MSTNFNMNLKERGEYSNTPPPSSHLIHAAAVEYDDYYLVSGVLGATAPLSLHEASCWLGQHLDSLHVLGEHKQRMDL